MDDSHQHTNYAARRPAGSENPITLTKNGVFHTQRLPDGTTRDILAVGLACSECFSGTNLHKVLASGFEYERQVMENLAAGAPAAPLSIHTSSGVSAALGPFLQALEIHLPWQNKEELDWCVSLQIEGASAVHAAIDMVLQVAIFDDASNKNRTKVAVGATSYHGPPSTSPGAKSPLWYKNHQLIYPVPTAFGPYDEAELLEKYKTFLDQHAHEIGVMLIEPQWGSSQAALPWPEHLLKIYVEMAKERGIKIICDEIMCGLGRHGKGTLFVSQAWDLDPDAVTFGKAIATGVFQLSGAILKKGRKTLFHNKCSVLQSHTYAGSSARALMAATSVLQEFVSWLPSVAQLGKEMAIIMSYINRISQGLFICHGQGLMWGGIVSYDGQCRDAEFRRNVVLAFKKHCEDVCVVPYHIPVGGFMVSPVIDIDVGTIYEIGNRLEEAIKRTMLQVGWNPITEKPDEEKKTEDASDYRVGSGIASKSSLDLACMLTHHEAGDNHVAFEQDFAYGKCVPHLHRTRSCTRCNSFVRAEVRTHFLGPGAEKFMKQESEEKFMEQESEEYVVPI